MMHAVRRALVTLTVLAVGLAAPTAPARAAQSPAQSSAPQPAQSSSGPRSAVTWDGWRGVSLGQTLTSAHRRLGGTLLRVDPGGGCGDVLTTRTGTLDGNSSNRPHRVGTIRVDRPIAYPLGVRATMAPSKIERVVERSGYTLRTTRYDPYDTGDYIYLNYVVGPRGHTLYYSYGDGTTTVDRIGLAVSKRVARGQLLMNSC